MSTTKVDMPKVTQMLDAGWKVRIEKNEMGSYSACAFHKSGKVRQRVQQLLKEAFEKNWEGNPYAPEYDVEWDWDDDDHLITDDFTPEQALTRLAYKCHGEVL